MGERMMPTSARTAAPKKASTWRSASARLETHGSWRASWNATLGLLASPSYLKRRGTPKNLADLKTHDCSQFVLPSTGRLLPWLFRKLGRWLAAHDDDDSGACGRCMSFILSIN
jgi:hypothetical protein